MSSVDNRIVNMEFKSDQFKSGVTGAQKSLTGLESTLSKAGKSGGLKDMDAAAGGLKNKFSALQVAGVAAVATIASKATLAGLSLVKSFTLDPIMQGFDEYNTNLKSIQTIIANTGAKLPVVTGYLEKLNAYSDQTIYSFSEMAKNIGTFTAAGVGLKESVSSIQGISNIAALSGSSSQQASTAMYQLSQAIAAGRVNLQDWNSVVNAGMGGKNLQTALLQTGVAMGELDEGAVKLGKNIKVMGMSFRESISAGGDAPPWLTSDVLTKTLSLMDGRLSKSAIAATDLSKSTAEVNKELERQQDILREEGYTEQQIKSLTDMADAAYQSATVVKTLPQLMEVTKEQIGSVWAQAFAQILGNFNQAKALWTAVSNSVGTLVMGFGQTLIGSLKAWNEQGGRDAVIEGFKNGFTALGKILGTVKDAFRTVFPPNSASALAAFSKGFRDFTAALIPSQNTVEAIQSVFEAFFTILKVGGTIIGVVASVFVNFAKAIFGGSTEARGGILSLIGSVAEAVTAFGNWLLANDKIITALRNIGTMAGTVIKPVISAVGSIIQAFASLATGGGMEGFFKNFDEAKGSISNFVGIVSGGLASLFAPVVWLSDLLEKLSTKANELEASFVSVSGIGDSAKGLADAATGSLTLSGGLDKVKSSAGSVKGAVSGMLGGLSGKEASSALSNTKSLSTSSVDLSAAGQEVGSRWAGLKSMFMSIGEGIKTTFSAIGDAASWVKTQLSDLFGGYDAIDWASLVNMIFSGFLIVAIRNTIKEMGSFKASVIGAFDELTNTLKTMQGAIKAQMILNIAIAVGVLAASLLVLSFIPMDKLAKGLGAMAIMIGLLVVALSTMSKIGSSIDENGETINRFNFNLLALGAAMLLIATSMIVLAGAVAIFGNMDIATLAKGLVGMAIGLGILLAAMFAFSKFPESQVVAFAAAMMILATAMNTLAVAVFAFGMMDMGILAQGLGAIAFAMGLMVISMQALSEIGPQILASAGAILIISYAMGILAGVVLIFGMMDLATLAQGFTMLAIGLGIMVVALSLLGANAAGVLAAGASMMMMAIAMNMLVSVVVLLGTLPWQVVATGLGFVAAGLALLLVAGAAAMVVGPGLLALGASVALLGGAMFLAGAGMLAFGTGFAIMAGAGVAGVAVLVAAFKAFIALLPSIGISVAAAFVTFVETIARAAPRIRQAMGTIFREMIGVVKDSIPQIASLLRLLISTGISVIVGAAPQFIRGAFIIMNAFLNEVQKNVPTIVPKAVAIAVAFMKAIGDQAGRLAQAAATMIIKFINSVADAIRNNAAEIGKAGANLATAIIDGITGGLLSKGIAAVQWAIGKVADAIPGPIKKLLGISSPSKVAFYWGEMIGAGLAGGLMASIKTTVSAAVNMADAVIAAGNSSVAAYQKTARTKQIAADRALAAANATSVIAAKTTDKKRKKALNATAAKQKKTAEAAQKAADTAEAAVTRVAQFEAGDFDVKGDMRKADALSDADTAARLLAKASADNAAYKRVRKTNKKAAAALNASSIKAAKDAKIYADRAQKNQKESLAFYAKTVDERVNLIEEERQAKIDAEKAEKELSAADGDGRVAILLTRSELNQKKADVANAQAKALVEQAKALAASNAVEAMKLLDQSEEQAKLAEELAKKAQEERDASLQESENQTTQLTPSQNILADASSAVDRYTKALEDAQTAAAATQQPMQYVQNNYSPVALSASEVYRQTNNLLSSKELKMGVKSN